MNSVILFLSCLIIIFPIIITLLSFIKYNNTGNKNKLLTLTLPNFILTTLISVMSTFFVIYSNNYIDAFEVFLNGISNGKVYMWVLLVAIVVQVAVTCINGINIANEISNNKTTKPTNKKYLG